MSDQPYTVGYRRPPTHSRFKKGQSGNPRGKAKGRKNFKTELLEELSERVTVTENGRQRVLPMQTVFLKRLMADAVNGDAKARDQLIKLIGQLASFDTGPDTATPTTAEDLEIMTRFKARLIEEIKAQEAAD